MILSSSSYVFNLVFSGFIGFTQGPIVSLQRLASWLRSPSLHGSLKVVKRGDAFSTRPKPTVQNEITCPYEYILWAYGKRHFAKFVDTLKPNLSSEDPTLYDLVLDIMDAVHFGAILVDDIADNSLTRKGKPAAHCIYGSSETINRAYLRIMEVVNRCSTQRPALLPYVLANLEEIHEGQDISLVWRRDGFENFPDQESALKAYRHCAYLKTGALFRLLGQLVFASHEKDELMSKVGWYCQLQNDCKNIYSTDVIASKGTLAEDLINGEYTFPIIVALYNSSTAQAIIKKAMEPATEVSSQAITERHLAAVRLLQTDQVKSVCMQELDSLKGQVSLFAAVWGRAEKMTVKPATVESLTVKPAVVESVTVTTTMVE